MTILRSDAGEEVRTYHSTVAGDMQETWWVRPNQLDPEQQQAIGLPSAGNYLVTGPPGSGKSNLLLLRATQSHLAGRSNFAIVVFTKSLKGFLSHGHEYDFPLERLTTYHAWAFRLLRENHLSAGLPKDFDAARQQIATRLTDLIARGTFNAIAAAPIAPPSTAPADQTACSELMMDRP